MATLNVGDEVPDFEFPAVMGNIKTQFKLSEYRGKKNVVLASSGRLDAGVCLAAARSEHRPGALRGYGTQVVGLSVDSIASHTAWQKKEIGVLGFPLASDFYPHGDVARKFGILREGDPIPGINERAIFIVGKDGKLAFAKIYPIGQLPGNDEIFRGPAQAVKSKVALRKVCGGSCAAE